MILYWLFGGRLLLKCVYAVHVMRDDICTVGEFGCFCRKEEQVL